jgi:hypothetical protein
MTIGIPAPTVVTASSKCALVALAGCCEEGGESALAKRSALTMLCGGFHEQYWLVKREERRNELVASLGPCIHAAQLMCGGVRMT